MHATRARRNHVARWEQRREQLRVHGGFVPDGDDGGKLAALPAALSTTKARCELCALNSFKNVTGNQRCTQCVGNNRVTLEMGSTSSADCVCKAGTTELDGGTDCGCAAGEEPVDGICRACKLNFFKDAPGDVLCSRCTGANRVTLAPGARTRTIACALRVRPTKAATACATRASPAPTATASPAPQASARATAATRRASAASRASTQRRWHRSRSRSSPQGELVAAVKPSTEAYECRRR